MDGFGVSFCQTHASQNNSSYFKLHLRFLMAATLQRHIASPWVKHGHIVQALILATLAITEAILQAIFDEIEASQGLVDPFVA